MIARTGESDRGLFNGTCHALTWRD